MGLGEYMPDGENKQRSFIRKSHKNFEFIMSGPKDTGAMQMQRLDSLGRIANLKDIEEYSIY